MRWVYLDYAATTPMRPEVLTAMEPFYTTYYGNPSSLHWQGDIAVDALQEARSTIAQCIAAAPGEIYFTGGGTEANNLALKGIAKQYRPFGNHIIVSQIEHDSVLSTCRFLEEEGFRITYLPVGSSGQVCMDELQKCLTDQTILVSVMHANNEVGTIQPIEQIGSLLQNSRKKGEKTPVFHCDAVQSLGKESVDVTKMKVDLLSASAHKVYGPKGVGFLYVRKGIRLVPLSHGGGQENGYRSGTENVAGIVGMAKAFQLAIGEQEATKRHLAKLRNHLVSGLEKINGVKITGISEQSLASHIHFRVEGIEGQAIMLECSRKGIAISTGSACHSGQWHPSHVLLAMGYSADEAHQGVRVSLGKDATEEDLDYFVEMLFIIVHRFQNLLI